MHTPMLTPQAGLTGFLFRMERSVGFIWTLLLSAASPGCGGILTKPSGKFSSPKGPTHSIPLKCVWSIQVEFSHRVSLAFPHLNLSCATEYVEVFDGTPTSRSLGKICNGLYLTYQSSANIMTVVFSRNSSHSSTWFDGYYYAELEASTLITVPTTALPCGGLLLKPKGTFSSPSYLENYPHSVQCVWEIEVPKTYRISLTLKTFEDEHSLSCSSSHVDIFDGSQSSSDLLGRFCDTSNETFLSPSNKMKVQFSSDSFVTKSGFQASYFALPRDNNDTALSCTEDQMYVAVSEQYLQSLGYSAENISLHNSSCEPEVITNYIIFSIPFNGCGTVIQEKDDTIIYSNLISTNQFNRVISRLKNFHLHVSCRMNKHITVEVKYLTDDAIDIVRHQYGHYRLKVSFYESPLFEHPVIESPYYVQLNQDVFFQLMLSHFDPNLALSVDTCVASPYADDFKTVTYDLIRHGCVRDPTYTAYSSPNPNVVKFKFNAFKFLKQHDAVYLKCQMSICRADDPPSQCLQGCTLRSKRETHPEWDNLDVVVGPVRLRRETSLEKRSAIISGSPHENGIRYSFLLVTTVMLGIKMCCF
ncbi:deleted in malignant brain tumors 1 protein-like [Dromiciops gliroides]|uniref:deleted in malignant brain tumors 1 protein-like n=1 Tax=Dromiciops gliroides TaxID=33562 RepID=UPI001CC53AA9|nr:deleted in malignant brain tumors 1 protein-like [Dromiciops gliroides]